jgi:hypothetical protein
MKGHNFLNSNSIFYNFIAPDAPIGGVHVLFKPQKNGALPLDLAYLERLSVIVAI